MRSLSHNAGASPDLWVVFPLVCNVWSLGGGMKWTRCLVPYLYYLLSMHGKPLNFGTSRHPLIPFSTRCSSLASPLRRPVFDSLFNFLFLTSAQLLVTKTEPTRNPRQNRWKQRVRRQLEMPKKGNNQNGQCWEGFLFWLLTMPAGLGRCGGEYIVKHGALRAFNSPLYNVSISVALQGGHHKHREHP